VASARRALGGVDIARVDIAEDDGVASVSAPGARGFAAYEDDWVGFRGIEVAPEHRRQGLARTIMAALLAWSAELGATTAYLQVLGDNSPALTLYESLGFTTHHQYAYLTPHDRH
jgi:GNAT superfamily N-acetyltransferase